MDTLFVRGIALLPVTGAEAAAGVGSAGWNGFGAGGNEAAATSVTLAGS